MEKDVAVPMRDGVTLRADVLRPRGAGGFPVLVYRTPYGKEPTLEEYSTFRHAVEHGYAVVVQDVRGRYGSEGTFVHVRPILEHKSGPKDIDESTDAYDTIDWLVKNIPGNNGKVGLSGISYPGF